MSRSLLPILASEPTGEDRDHSHGSGGHCGHGAVNAQEIPEELSKRLRADEFVGNVALVTLGCAKNLVDSEVMLGALQARGFRPVSDPKNAELIVVNTCAFLQSAVEEGIDTILDLAKLKQTGRCRQLFVAGCMVERYRGELEASLPEVDRFVSTDELLRIGQEEGTTQECFDSARRPYFLYDETMPRLRATAPHTAYVKIAEGCDRPCSFCIIPKIRGKFRSRSIDSVASEVSTLVGDGTREVNLVAQDLTAYGSDWEGNRGVVSQLPRLLEQFNSIQPDIDFWVRLLYAYPIGVNAELIDRIRDSRVVCNYLDLPLQHISNAVLKGMNRPLGEKGTRRVIEELRSRAPEIAIRTTFIVGFPGETEEDVDRLHQFISEGHFAHVGIFTYSQESESKAFHFPDQIEEAVKNERRARLMECQQQVLASRLEGFVGQNIKVLLEGAHADSDLLLVGRAEWQAPETDGEVIINDIEGIDDGPEGLIEAEKSKGRFAEVEITEVAGYDLVGKLNRIF